MLHFPDSPNPPRHDLEHLTAPRADAPRQSAVALFHSTFPQSPCPPCIPSPPRFSGLRRVRAAILTPSARVHRRHFHPGQLQSVTSSLVAQTCPSSLRLFPEVGDVKPQSYRTTLHYARPPHPSPLPQRGRGWPGEGPPLSARLKSCPFSPAQGGEVVPFLTPAGATEHHCESETPRGNEACAVSEASARLPEASL